MQKSSLTGRPGMDELNINNWIVYIIHCSDDSYYTGITNNLEQRLQQHQQGKGAKYFRGREPLEVVYTESVSDRSAASKREAAIKKLTRLQKLELIMETED